MNKYKRIGLFIVIFGLIGIRFINVLKRPMYLDEGIYMSWAEAMSRSRDNAYVSLSDGKTPLFYWSMSWLDPLIGNYLLTGRIISILSGLVTALSWVIIFYLNFNFKISLIFLILFLISPYGVFIERLAFSDSLMLCLASLSLLFLILFKKNIDKKKKLNLSVILMGFSGLFMGMSFAVKTSAKLFFVGYILVFLFWFADYIFRKKDIKRFLILLLGLVLYIAMYREIINCFRVGGHILWNSISDKEKLMVYAPSQVLKILLSNPLYIFNYSNLIFQYLFYYLSGIFIFFVLGIFGLVKKEQNRKFLWLLIYLAFGYFGISLSGRVMASRYIYSIYPVFIAIAVFGLDYFLSLKALGVKALVFALLIFVFLQSSLLIFSPEKALYATDDKNYFVKSHLTAIGLSQVIDYFKDMDKENVVVGVSGIWGIPEGSVILLEQSGINSQVVNIEGILKEKETINNKCDKGWFLIENSCFRLEYDSDKYKDFKKYAYVVGNDETVEKMLRLNADEIYKFSRNEGESSSYFFEIVD